MMHNGCGPAYSVGGGAMGAVEVQAAAIRLFLIVDVQRIGEGRTSINLPGRKLDLDGIGGAICIHSANVSVVARADG